MTPHWQQRKRGIHAIASVKPNDLAVVDDEDFILGIGIVTDFHLFRA
jgi:hypothetical protein